MADESLKRIEHMKKLMNDPAYRKQIQAAGSAFTASEGPTNFIVKEAADKLADAKVSKFNFPDRLKKFGKGAGKLGAALAVIPAVMAGSMKDASASLVDTATPLGLESDSLGFEKGSLDEQLESGNINPREYEERRARIEALKDLKR